ncbi:hypothetical protein WMF11_46415 [Sorangium sp. So ce295]|uniref:hypothetical protein n=1 Tax=Sorangium sp. So ce295 TaxID=3133295 RepID=UPI003F602A5C
MTLYDDHYCRWSYEQLLLQQPQIQFAGLWRQGYQHYIVCPTLSTAKAAGGEDLRLWFDKQCRVVTAPVKIVEQCPAGAERVPERTCEERARLAGAPRTRRDVLVDLGLALPPDFPPFTIDDPGTDVVFVTTRKLSDTEKSQVSSAYAEMGYGVQILFAVDPSRDPQNETFRFEFGQGDIDLLPSRRLPTKYSRDLRFLMEDDEEAWAASRERLFASSDSCATELLPVAWQHSRGLSCLVDATVFAPDDIRSQLCLYDTVLLALPLENSFEENCAALGVSSEELSRLVELGRVRILLPQAIDRYPLNWLAALAERAPKSILLSRRLAAATVADARNRVPLLYPPLSPVERHAMLHMLTDQASNLVGPARAADFVQFVYELGATWAGAEWSVSSRGAMGTSHLGIGAISSAVYQQVTGRDLRLELWSAAQKVEWAAALGAHVFPSSAGEYDESAACDLVAGIYGGGFVGSTRSRFTLSAVSDLLALSSKVDVVDLAKEFSSADIKRLRDLIDRISRENIDPDYLKDAIGRFNAEVRHYEKRPDLLKSVNVVGLMSAGLAAAGIVDPSIAHVVPLAGIMLGFVLNRVIDELPRHSAPGGRVIDFCNSLLTARANPDAVLVARARKDVGRIKRP